MMMFTSTSDTPAADASQSPVSMPRVIAILLAVGGSFWGVWLLLVIGSAALIPFPFGVGYLVTTGYIARAVSIPSLGVRRALWGASLLVQGAWLLALGISDLPRTGPFFWLWAFATAASAIALATERAPEADSGTVAEHGA